MVRTEAGSGQTARRFVTDGRSRVQTLMSSQAAEIAAEDLIALVTRIFTAAGLREADAERIARGMVEADLEGLSSHGVMLADMYVDRLRAGSISTRSSAEIVSDHGTAVVLDGAHAFGHLTGDQAIAIAVERAGEHCAGIVAVRHGFHFGAAAPYARQAAEKDCIGIVMCNTRPLMPAPGGAERVVGNNPIAIAVPTDGPIPLALDMATSEAAMGKIRMAEKAARDIPGNWAVQNDGSPTTDPKQAISGMLLPAAGPKGFGLALMIDLMCGLLSGGGFGSAVNPLYGDPAIPYDCSHLFIAIDAGHFCDPAWFRAQAASAAERIRQGRRAPGVPELFLPGEPEWRKKQASHGRVRLDAAVAASLLKLAASLNVSAERLTATATGEAINAKA
jgi:LDH2 family malate/lactate/ureidoglycolate dehydrogenase